VRERDRDERDRQRAHHGHHQRLLAVQDRGHHEHEHQPEADRKAHQRQRAAPAREREHHEHEQARQEQHRTAPLEVLQRVPRARHRLRAGWRLGRLRHADLVPGVHVRVEPARVELDLHPLALLGAALDARGGELALLAAEAGAEPLLDLLDRRLLALDGDPLGHLRLDLSRPEHDQPGESGDRERRGHQGEEAGHRARGSPWGRPATR
jgi:hypothetical protein